MNEETPVLGVPICVTNERVKQEGLTPPDFSILDWQMSAQKDIPIHAMWFAQFPIGDGFPE